jgi:hypothetical protein
MRVETTISTRIYLQPGDSVGLLYHALGSLPMDSDVTPYSGYLLVNQSLSNLQT